MPSLPAVAPGFESLNQLLQTRSREAGDNPYIFLPDDGPGEAHLTLAALDIRARVVAAALQERGAMGRPVLLGYPAGLEFLVGFFGCLYAGAVAVPAYPPRARRADPRLEGIAADCDPAAVLTTAELARDRDRLTAHSPRLRALDWLATSDLPDDLAGQWHDPRPCSTDLAVFQYTSGSTGHPKGVMLTHGHLLHNLRVIREAMRFGPGRPGVSWLPAFHDMGLIGNFLGPVSSGCPFVFMSPAAFARDPLRWLRVMSDHRGYISGGPTFAYRLCAERITPEEAARLDLSRWRVAYVGAEPVAVDVLERFAAALAPAGFRPEAFYPCYGLAEATLYVTGRRGVVARRFQTDALEEGRAVPDANGRALVSCGPAPAGEDVCTVDPATASPRVDGQIGEVWVASPSVAAGYWGRPEESAATFTARRADRDSPCYLRTGDLGFLRDGELFITGRIKDLIIVCGRNHYPQDIEAAVAAACPELTGCGAAFTVGTDDDPRLVLVHEIVRGTKPDAQEGIFPAARQTVAEDFGLELSTLVLVRPGGVPRSSSGKVRRQECRRRFEAGELEAVARWDAPAAPPPEAAPPAATDAEAVCAWLVARLAARLGMAPEQIDRDRPFASYGLDSISVVATAGELERWLGRPLSPVLFYEAPTIAALARRITAGPQPHVTTADPGAVPGSVPIAVVGIGCRFPGAAGPDEFWRLLSEGRCTVGEPPPARAAVRPKPGTPAAAGYLEDVRPFDAAFFGIAPREAVSIDPQHRLLLETAWEALEHAGLAADQLAGSAAGVFVGVSGNEYGRLLVNAGQADAYLGTGNSASMAAHRLSYHLDLRGPSVAVDTACSSSLVAVHLACQSLRTGECDVALAAGVNLILMPAVTEALAEARMLSPSGRCRTFDAAADGYVRGEGCGVVVLKPLTAALRDGDRVFAVIEATATNQDGRSNGITAPNGAAQADLIRRALRLADRSPADVSYVETHGTGTVLGDPIEFDALSAALGADGSPCAIGSVKTNLGHLEAAAGIAGFIKAVLQLHHGRIAPHLHLESVNPHLRLSGSRFRVPRTVEAWAMTGTRVAGVSSFGFGGTNVHAVLAEAPLFPTSAEPDAGQHLFVLSAKSAPALRELATRAADRLNAADAPSLADACHTVAVGRSHFENRLAVTGSSTREVAEQLRRVRETHHLGARKDGALHAPHVAFLFPGQGAQYAGMGRELAEACPAFRSHLDHCDAILRDLGLPPLADLLADAERLDETDAAQPALFAVSYALAQTWRGWGVEPKAVLGHSAGEYAAACVAGVLSLEDGLRLIAERGRLMQQCPPGSMLACFGPPERVEALLAPWAGRVVVACLNGPENVVVSGDPEAVAAVGNALTNEGIPTRLLRSRRAFHAPLIEPALDGLRSAAALVAHRPPAIRLVSNLTGGFVTAVDGTDYWPWHARSPVRFADGVQTLLAAGVTHFLEVGPGATLGRLGEAVPGGSAATWLSPLRRGGEWAELLASLGRLYADGTRIDWHAFDVGRPRRRVTLPTYPFQRQIYWFEEAHNPADATGFDRLPGRLLGVAAPAVAEARRRHRPEQHAAVRGLFDELAGSYIRGAFATLGWEPVAGERFTTEELADRLNVRPQSRRLLNRLLAMAAEDGWLARTAHGWRVVADPLTEEAAVLHQNLVARFPDFGADLQLARHCATGLPGVLRGETDPLELLFGGEAAQLTERLYEQSPPARFANEALARAVEALVNRLPAGRPIRVLELGAGTGGTTAHLLPMLPADRTEYVFTDVSPLFLATTREKFGAYPFVQYRRLDLEDDPAGQGFAEHDFDLIVAANVFHATADLRRSVRHARQLLGPSGVLVLLEGTGPRRLLDLIFGLTDGWWRFADADLRPDYPLISADRWARLLADEGFGQVACLPAPDGAMPDPDQVVILALGPSGVARSVRPTVDRSDAPQALPVAEVLAVASAGREALRAAPPAERRVLLEEFLRREFAAVAGVRLSDDELSKPLHAFGLDSLMAMQLRNRVESGLGVSLSLVQVLRGLSLRELVDDALRTLAASDTPPAEPAPDRLRLAGLAAEQVDALPAGELDSLLHSLLEQASGPQPVASEAYHA